MRKRIRFRSGFEWLLAARAMVTMTTVVVAIRVLPYKTWRRLAIAKGRVRRRNASIVSAQQLIRAIETASRFVPGGTNCFVRALSTRTLMSRYGLGSTIRLGVARAPSGELAGHAWLEHQGAVLVGEQGREGFVPMPDLEERL